MPDSSHYRQCMLQRPLGDGRREEMVSFIPAQFARLHRPLKLKTQHAGWEDGWLVASIGATVDDAHLPDAHAEIRSHRRATGDSLPRRPSEDR